MLCEATSDSVLDAAAAQLRGNEVIRTAIVNAAVLGVAAVGGVKAAVVVPRVRVKVRVRSRVRG